LDNEDTFYDITFLDSFEDIFKNEIIFSFVPFSESRSIFYADDELISKSILECLNESEKYEEVMPMKINFLFIKYIMHIYIPRI
jgi:hypothetical protein